MESQTKKSTINNSKLLKAPASQPASTLKKLFKQTKDKSIFCDVILQVEEKEFYAHRSVLAASSEFFFKMFNLEMKEKYNKNVRLHDIKAEIVGEILRWIYVGEIALTDITVADVLKAASMMQHDLFDVIAEHMGKNMNKKNCFLYFELSIIYDLQKLESIVNSYFISEFDDVSIQNGLLNFKSNMLFSILSADALKVQKEEEVFQFILKWINVDVVERQNDFSTLLELVRLHYIPHDYICNEIATNKFIKENQDCMTIVNDGLAFHLSVLSKTKVERQKPRQHFSVFLEISKPSVDIRSNSIMIFSVGKSLFRVCTEQGEDWCSIEFAGKSSFVPVNTENFGVALNFPISVFCGGKLKSNSSPANDVIKFDGEKWTEMEPMRVDRIGAAAAFHGSDIYVFGGEKWDIACKTAYNFGPDMKAFEQSCEKIYCSEQQKSSEVFHCPFLPRSYSSAQSVDESSIFLIGGWVPNINRKRNPNRAIVPFKIACDETLVYYPSTQTWKESAKLNSARAEFACGIVDSKIYVVGGQCELSSFYLNHIEFTSTCIVKWTKVTASIPHNIGYTPLPTSSGCVLNNKIYFVAKRSYNSMTKWHVCAYDCNDKSIKCVHSFDHLSFSVAIPYKV